MLLDKRIYAENRKSGYNNRRVFYLICIALAITAAYASVSSCKGFIHQQNPSEDDLKRFIIIIAVKHQRIKEIIPVEYRIIQDQHRYYGF